MPDYTVRLLQDGLNEVGLPIRGAKVAVLGVAYKRNVDDPRESPFYEIRDILIEKRALISVYDSWFDSENTHQSLEEAIDGCVAVVLVTDHSDMVKELLNKLNDSQSIKVFIDGRNALTDIKLQNSIKYLGIGVGRKNSNFDGL